MYILSTPHDSFCSYPNSLNRFSSFSELLSYLFNHFSQNSIHRTGLYFLIVSIPPSIAFNSNPSISKFIRSHYGKFRLSIVIDGVYPSPDTCTPPVSCNLPGLINC